MCIGNSINTTLTSREKDSYWTGLKSDFLILWINWHYQCGIWSKTSDPSVYNHLFNFSVMATNTKYHWMDIFLQFGDCKDFFCFYKCLINFQRNWFVFFLWFLINTAIKCFQLMSLALLNFIYLLHL